MNSNNDEINLPEGYWQGYLDALEQSCPPRWFGTAEVVFCVMLFVAGLFIGSGAR